MVDMVACLHLKSLCLCGIFLLQFSDDWLCGVFNKITLFNHKLRCILQPHVVAESTFASLLESRAIAAVSGTVVLPCDVVHTFRIHTSIASVAVKSRLTLGNGEHGLSVWTYGSLDKQFSVVGELVRHLLSEGVGHDKLASALDAETREHLFGVNLNHFLSLDVVSVAHHQFECLVVCRIHCSILETHALTSCEQESSSAEVGNVLNSKELALDGAVADRLHISYSAVGLECCLREILPCEVCHRLVFLTVEQSMVHTPIESVGEECSTAGLITFSLFGVEHRACPVSFLLLA